MPLDLPDRLDALLRELDALWSAEPRERIVVAEVIGAPGVSLWHRDMTQEWADASPEHRRATIADFEDLETAGAIDALWTQGRNGRRAEVRLTPAGEAHVRRPPPPAVTPDSRIGSDWQLDVMPLLYAAFELEQEMSPAAGVTQDAVNLKLGRPPGDPRTSTTLAQLSDAGGYLRDEVSYDQRMGPDVFRLGERALQRVAGWPGDASGDLAAQLLVLLDDRLADPGLPEEERGRLKRLRDTAADVGKGTLSGLLTALIKSQV